MIISSCKSKNAEELFSSGPCDTLHLNYSTTITKIISENCSGCHRGSNASGNPQVRLDSYDGVKTVADNGILYKALTGVTKQMPPSGKLTECPISQVKAWIDSGSPNN